MSSKAFLLFMMIFAISARAIAASDDIGAKDVDAISQFLSANSELRVCVYPINNMARTPEHNSVLKIGPRIDSDSKIEFPVEGSVYLFKKALGVRARFSGPSTKTTSGKIELKYPVTHQLTERTDFIKKGYVYFELAKVSFYITAYDSQGLIGTTDGGVVELRSLAYECKTTF